MPSIKVHGFVHIWTKKTGITKLKQAFIEIVEEKKKVKLVVSFKSGEPEKIFQLSNNTARIVLKSGRERRSCRLHVVLQNNISLLIDKLSHLDAKHLRKSLDIFCRNIFRPMKPKSKRDAPENRDMQKTSRKTLYKRLTLTYRSFGAEKYRTSFLQKKRLLMLKSTLVKRELKKTQAKNMKKRLSPGLKANEDLKKKNNQTLKTYFLKYVSSKRKKALNSKDLESNRNSKQEPSSETKSSGNADPDETGPSTHTFLSGSESGQDTPGGSEAQLAASSPLEATEEGLEPGEASPSAQDFQPGLGFRLARGFPNLGNSCYMNSVLQSLFAMPSFASDLLMQGIPWERVPYNTLFMCLSQLLILKDISQVQTKTELLLCVKEAVAEGTGLFSGNMQNDAHEFLGQCLSQIKEDTEKLNFVFNTEWELGHENSSPQWHAGDAARKAFTCPVATNFEFELQNSIICKSCGHTILKTETNNYLSLDLHFEADLLLSSVQRCLDAFFRPEELEYKCEKCQHKRAVLKQRLRRLPRVLILHLKRYTLDNAWMPVKNTQPVWVCRQLNVSAHCSEDARPPPPVGNRVLARGAAEPGAGLAGPSALPAQRAAEPAGVPGEPAGGPREPAGSLGEPAGGPGEPAGGPREPAGSLGEPAGGPGEPAGGPGEPAGGPGEPAGGPGEPAGGPGEPAGGPGEPAGAPGEPVGTASAADVPPPAGEDARAARRPPEPGRAGLGLPRAPEAAGPEDRERSGVSAFFDCCRIAQMLAEFSESFVRKLAGFPAAAGQLQHHYSKSLEEALLPPTPPPRAKAEAPPHGAQARPGRGHYRLVSVVSHLGGTQHSGHYVSDAYDFQRQQWFTYDDLKVLQVPEALVQEARRCTGYIFFYMHREVYKALVEIGKQFPAV